jgi:hypothetical protein
MLQQVNLSHRVRCHRKVNRASGHCISFDLRLYDVAKQARTDLMSFRSSKVSNGVPDFPEGTRKRFERTTSMKNRGRRGRISVWL